MLHYNKSLYSDVNEEIYELENEISDQKEMILQDKKDLVQINFKILQARNKYTHEYMFSIREYLLFTQKIHREYLNRSLSSISELRKRILTC